MPLSVGVPKETAAGETRVAFVPDVVRRLTGAGVEVVVEEGAGEGAYHADADYEDAGAQVARREDALGADVVAVVSPPSQDELAHLGDGQVLVGLLDPLGAPERIQALAEAGVTALSMELVPRISRAQKMDALSAMSSLAGYRAALIGAHALPKFFPLLTTAAGTIRPARVLVLGAGVAGLQAIATAKRLGARVSGYDIRAATQEEVESLGAQFVELTLDAEGEGEGGYAKELEQEKQERQPELLQPHVAEADVVISTALIPGRDAPLLISEEAVAAMAPGSVVVDLAAPGGGNCALTEAGETTQAHGVQVFGPLNLPAEMPVHASQLYARTVAALLQEFIDEEGRFAPDAEDEIFAGACVARDGVVRASRVREALGLAPRMGDGEEHGEERAEAPDEAEPGEAEERTGEAPAPASDESDAERPDESSRKDAAPEAASDASGASDVTEGSERAEREEPTDEDRAAGGESAEKDADAKDGVEDDESEDAHEEWKPPAA